MYWLIIYVRIKHDLNLGNESIDKGYTWITYTIILVYDQNHNIVFNVLLNFQKWSHANQNVFAQYGTNLTFCKQTHNRFLFRMIPTRNSVIESYQKSIIIDNCSKMIMNMFRIERDNFWLIRTFLNDKLSFKNNVVMKREDVNKKEKTRESSKSGIIKRMLCYNNTMNFIRVIGTK